MHSGRTTIPTNDFDSGTQTGHTSGVTTGPHSSGQPIHYGNPYSQPMHFPQPSFYPTPSHSVSYQPPMPPSHQQQDDYTGADQEETDYNGEEQTDYNDEQSNDYNTAQQEEDFHVQQQAYFAHQAFLAQQQRAAFLAQQQRAAFFAHQAFLAQQSANMHPGYPLPPYTYNPMPLHNASYHPPMMQTHPHPMMHTHQPQLMPTHQPPMTPSHQLSMTHSDQQHEPQVLTRHEDTDEEQVTAVQQPKPPQTTSFSFNVNATPFTLNKRSEATKKTESPSATVQQGLSLSDASPKPAKTSHLSINLALIQPQQQPQVVTSSSVMSTEKKEKEKEKEEEATVNLDASKQTVNTSTLPHPSSGGGANTSSTAALTQSLMSSALAANVGNDDLVHSNPRQLLQVPRRISHSYRDTYRNFQNHPMFLALQQNDLSHDSVSPYLSHLGRVKGNKRYLMSETDYIRGIAKDVYTSLYSRNENQKRLLNQPYAEEELRCLSFIDVSIKGTRHTFVAVSGSDNSSYLNSYLEELKGRKNFSIVPPPSSEFKRFFRAMAKDMGITLDKKYKVCAELALTATLGKLLYHYGQDLQINGIANVPILAVADYNTDDERLPEARLKSYDNHTKPERIEAPGNNMIHYWQCCPNCQTNKPAYLLMLGIMQDLGDQNQKALAEGAALPISEPFSPLRADERTFRPTPVTQLQPSDRSSAARTTNSTNSSASKADADESAASLKNSAMLTPPSTPTPMPLTNCRTEARNLSLSSVTHSTLYSGHRQMVKVSTGGNTPSHQSSSSKQLKYVAKTPSNSFK